MKTLGDYVAAVQQDEAAEPVLDSTLRSWQEIICRAIMQCDSRCMTTTTAQLRAVAEEIGAMRRKMAKTS